MHNTKSYCIFISSKRGKRFLPHKTTTMKTLITFALALSFFTVDAQDILHTMNVAALEQAETFSVSTVTEYGSVVLTKMGDVIEVHVNGEVYASYWEEEAEFAYIQYVNSANDLKAYYE